MSEFATKDTRFDEHQADVTLSQSSPGSGVQYTLLPATTFVKLLGAAAFVNWTVQPSPLEIHAVVDGNAYTWSQSSPVDDTWYTVRGFRSYVAPTAQLMDAAAVNVVSPILSGKSVAITAETTGGTVADLNARAIYSRYV